MIDDLRPPPTYRRSYDYLFITPETAHVQDPGESHETKKRTGSSDGAKTYDTPVT